MAQRDLNRGRSFDAVSRAYDRFRPRYPEAMFDAIDQCVDLGRRHRVLEVGCGTGQATEELLARGCHVHAVEPGASLANVASEKFKLRDFDVDLVTFEEFQPRGRLFDVVFSATAFHWIEPSMRWKKAAETLSDDGYIVLATNHTLDGASFNRFYDAAHDLLATYRSDDDVTAPPTEEEMVNSLHDARGDIGALWEVVEPQGSDVVAGELFRAPVVHWHRWRARYSTEGALGLLSTYSNYLTLSAGERGDLFGAMGRLIEADFGGELVRDYLTIVAMAQRA